MANIQDIERYCHRWSLTLVHRSRLDEMFGAEEWEGVTCAGFIADPLDCVAVIVLKEDGTVETVTAFADGIRNMEDVWTKVDEDRLHSPHGVHKGV